MKLDAKRFERQLGSWLKQPGIDHILYKVIKYLNVHTRKILVIFFCQERPIRWSIMIQNQRGDILSPDCRLWYKISRPSMYIFMSHKSPTFRGSLWSWWRHRMETFSALLALCAGNSPVPVNSPYKRPVTRSFDVFFDLRLINDCVNKREAGNLRRHRGHYDVIVMIGT